MTSPNGTQAIDRAALLLTRVVHGAEPASFAELTAASGLAKSTTSRLLTALERHQLVRRDQDGRFWPGELFVRYAWQGTAGADLVAVAQPYLDQLGELTGETINLGIVSSSGVTARASGGGAGSDARTAVVDQIAQVNSRYLIGGTDWVGRAVPLHCSASGKVLLAFGAVAVPPEPYRTLTKRTIATRHDLLAELVQVRERGYAVTNEELEPGLVAVAAPVFGGGTAAIAALSVSGPASRLDGKRTAAAAKACAEVARALSSTIGGQRADPA